MTGLPFDFFKSFVSQIHFMSVAQRDSFKKAALEVGHLLRDIHKQFHTKISVVLSLTSASFFQPTHTSTQHRL